MRVAALGAVPQFQRDPQRRQRLLGAGVRSCQLPTTYTRGGLTEQLTKRRALDVAKGVIDSRGAQTIATLPLGRLGGAHGLRLCYRLDRT